jgi:uncharacterized protein YegL
MSTDNALGHHGELVMPFYLVCDVSYSMHNEMTALHDGITRLWDAIVDEPLLDDVARVCIMSFSDEAKVLVSLSQMSDCEGMPKFEYERLTNYGAAFRALAATMVADYAALRGAGFRVYRPCVYFLTDGMPTDHDWRQTFNTTLKQGPMAQLGMPAYPIFVPFGFRDADEEVLRRLAYPPRVSKWYRAGNARIEEALIGLLGIIMKSVVKSSRSVREGEPEHVLPIPDYNSGIDCQPAENDPGT